MNGSGLVCLERRSLGYQATSQRYCSLTKHGVSAWRTNNSPILVGPEMENTVSNQEKTESSAVWASSKGICSEAPCGAAEQNPVEQRKGGTPLIGEEHLSIGSQTSENLEGLTEKVGTLGLQARKKNRCGTARKRARKARLAEDPAGDSSGGRPQSALADQPHTQQKPGTFGALQRSGPAPAKWTPLESGGGQMPGP